MLAVLTLTDRIRFVEGVVPAGSYSSVRYLVTGDLRLVKRALWPWSPGPQGTHHHIDQLARMEGCDWQDMQGALCYWGPWRRYARATDLNNNLEQDKDNAGEEWPAAPTWNGSEALFRKSSEIVDTKII